MIRNIIPTTRRSFMWDSHSPETAFKADFKIGTENFKTDADFEMTGNESPEMDD